MSSKIRITLPFPQISLSQSYFNSGPLRDKQWISLNIKKTVLGLSLTLKRVRKPLDTCLWTPWSQHRLGNAAIDEYVLANIRFGKIVITVENYFLANPIVGYIVYVKFNKSLKMCNQLCKTIG